MPIYHSALRRPSVIKGPHQLFWRWFYVSNWSVLQVVDRKSYQADIGKVLATYGEEFQQKATVEIIHCDRVEYLPASHFTQEDQ